MLVRSELIQINKLHKGAFKSIAGKSVTGKSIAGFVRCFIQSVSYTVKRSPRPGEFEVTLQIINSDEQDSKRRESC